MWYVRCTFNHISGGFTVIFHTCDVVTPPTLSSNPNPKQMQFVVYLTCSKVEVDTPHFDAPIAKTGQMFAAEIMTPHCTNYIATCIISLVDADMCMHIPKTDVPATRLITAPKANLSQYLFNRYPPLVISMVCFYRDHFTVRL